MTTRKRKKGRTKKISFRSVGSKKRKRPHANWFGPSLIVILKVLAAVCVLCGIVIGLIFLEKYVKKTFPAAKGTIDLELVDVPLWVSDELKEKVYAIATGRAGNLKLDEDTALSVQRNIEELIPWLDEIKVRTTHDRLRVEGQWRKPVALIKSGLIKFYVDVEQVVLDYIPMPNLPIIEVKGLPTVTKIPPLGEIWRHDDLAAAITILDRLDHMDKSPLTPEKPLLNEIDRIDVSNFNGRQNSRHAHIILYTKDNTEIIWGAEVGKWQLHLESTDEQKLAKLYGYYKEYGTLSGGAKYINLRDPRDNIPLPIDKY